jgi:hypothetical protein
MKVTLLLPYEVVEEVKGHTGGKNITESILIALQDYIARQRIKKILQKIKKKPLVFQEGFTAERARARA